MSLADVIRVPAASKRTWYKKPLRGRRYRQQRYVVRSLPMKTDEILFTSAELVEFSGVTEITLRQHEPEGFGSPRHWRMQGGQVIYTLAGARLLAQALSLAGFDEPATALLEAVNKVELARQVPVLVKPVDEPRWMKRADLQ
jgi:hypothetical protein